MQRLSSLAVQLEQNNTSQSQDRFAHVTLAPADPILGISIAYKADKSSDKMNLGVGAYRDNNEKPYVFNVVKKAINEIAKEVSENKQNLEYIPIEGLAAYNKLSQTLVFGDNNPLVSSGKVVTCQTLSGTGSLRVGFDFLKRFSAGDVYVSKPTWGNHHTIIKDAGLKMVEYPYFHPQTKGLDFEGMCKSLSSAKPGSIVLLHACAHNPTGVDPSNEQWKKIAEICKQGGLYPYFDSAYQGYASGCLVKDVESLRIFEAAGLQYMLSQSYAKNLGLYGERIGCLHIVTSDKDVANKVMSQVKLVVRAMYSSPPVHGALVVAKILGNPQYRAEWAAELKEVNGRIIQMRDLLKKELVANGCKGNWDHITNQIGMFSFTGLTTKQCECLINKWHIYLTKNGRVSMAGATTKNVKYLAQAIKDAVDTC